MSGISFLLDRNIPEALARMLDHFDRDNTVVFLDDRFDRRTPDVDWLRHADATDPSPVVVSGDGRILTNPAEAQILRGLSLTFFAFAPGWCQMPWADRAWKTVKIWPKIVENARPTHPTIYRVPVQAQKVERVCSTAELGRRRAKSRRKRK